MLFTIKDRIDHTEPAVYAIAPDQGSAYYMEGVGLIQVPLDTDGRPCWESLDDPDFYGGGQVDFNSAFEGDEQAARREVEIIREALRTVEQELARD